MLLALGLVEEEEASKLLGQSVAKTRLSIFAALASNVPPVGHSMVDKTYSSAAC